MTAEARSIAEIKLNWTDNSTNEDGFRIERKTSSSNYAEIASVGKDITSYTDAGLAKKTTYTYRVYAYNSGGKSLTYTNEASATTFDDLPATPVNLTAAGVSPSQINLAWEDKAVNETGYKVERKTGAGSFALVATIAPNATAYSDNGLTENTIYTYRVFPFNLSGAGAYSNEASSTTLSDIVSGLIAYFPFSGNAGDSSGNGNHGIVNGAGLTTDRYNKTNAAYNFSGTDFISGSCNTFPSGNSARTVSLWYNASNLGVTVPGRCGVQLFGYGGRNCGESYIMNFENCDIGLGKYEIQGHCLAFRNFANYPLPANNVWHHIVLTYDGQFFRFYNDGLLVSTSSQTTLSTFVSSKIFTIGKETTPDGGSPYTDPVWPGFIGKLDDIRIYSRALTQAQINYLFSN